MKAQIHPAYFDDCQVTCACGNSFTTGSTVPKMQLEVCNKCHPFFTGEMKYVDTLGRVEKFEKSRQKANEQKIKKAQLVKKQQETPRPQSLREMISLAKKQATS